jgi:hypothetical protein
LSNPKLIEKININDKNNKGLNILQIASLSKREDIVRYLIIEKEITVSSDTLNWLKGDNDTKEVFHNILKMIELREFNAHLNMSLNNKKEQITTKKKI